MLVGGEWWWWWVKGCKVKKYVSFFCEEQREGLLDVSSGSQAVAPVDGDVLKDYVSGY